MTGCHDEAQSRAAQISGIRELWSVISPKISTHSEFTTIILSLEYESSSPDADQWGPPHPSQGRLLTAWVLALLCDCNNSLTINSTYFVQRVIVSVNSLSQPSLYQSPALPSPREHHRYVHHRDTIGIQHHYWQSCDAGPCVY
jgi:hypothetical protein